MDYGSVPGVDKPFSRLVQGTVMVGPHDLDYSFRLLDDALELGINTFDTAHIYGGGDNERTVGAWVNSRGVRDRVVLIGKGAHFNADRQRVTPWDITSDLYDSLARFKTEYIDLYLLHRDDPSFPVEPIVDCLNEHMREGRIRAFGGSNWSVSRLKEANDYARSSGQTPFVASSPHFSLAEQYEEPWPGCLTITGAAAAPEREFYRLTQMPVFSWSSVANGFFSGRFKPDNLDSFEDGSDQLCVRCYCRPDNFRRLERAQKLAMEKGVTATQIALAWLLRQPLNVFPLVGARSRQELEANVAALQIPLTSGEMTWLNLESDSLQG
ncbi:MAG: aldo/keto reductase [Armatimonadota bacterium]